MMGECFEEITKDGCVCQGQKKCDRIGLFGSTNGISITCDQLFVEKIEAKERIVIEITIEINQPDLMRKQYNSNSV